MNRVDANAIRDLLSLDVDSSTLLPADDSSHGFDNIADVLGVSPSLLERYVAAAAKISRLAIGERDAAPAQVTYTVKGDLSQNRTLEGQPLGTRGGTSITHNFPVDGEYVIRLALLKLSFGQVFGEGAEGEGLEVTLNGQRVKLFKLDEVPMFFMRESPGSHPAKPQPTDPIEERVKMTPDIRLEFGMKVKAGRRRSASPSFRRHAANEDLVRRPVSSTYDVFIGMQYGYTTAPHLSRVVITGPYNPTDSATRPAVAGCSSARPRPRPTRRRARNEIISTLVAARVDVRRPRPTSSRCSPSIRTSAARPATSRPASRWRCAASCRSGSSSASSRRRRVPSRGSVSHQRHRARVTAVVLPLVVHPGRRAAEAGDRGQVAPAGRPRAADAPHARGPEGASAGHQLRQPVAVPARAEERQPRRHDLPDFDDNLRQAQRETELLFESVMREDRSVLDLLDSDYTFVNERLARHYGILNIYGPTSGACRCPTTRAAVCLATAACSSSPQRTARRR